MKNDNLEDNLNNTYFGLLKNWCDALISLQVQEIKEEGLYGGIMCPVCSRIHGRSSDAVYPLLYMADKTGAEKYLKAAKKLQSWSYHVSCPDGSWVNDPDHLWKGITVFGTIALGEALRHHGDILDKETYNKWLNRFKKAADFLYNFMDMSVGNINYPVTCSAAMAVAGRLLKQDKYLKKAEKLAHNSLNYFTDNMILYGEGHPQDGISERGCRPVDLGYNVEESLPGLTLYSLIMEDDKVLNKVIKALAAHLEFMLPDGAWDNSWGTRNFKWTYWGSRTSDGCQGAYTLLADRNPQFREAAFRNLKLFEKCTSKGRLHGGLHHYRRGELPCIHHTFCHGKALATALDYTEEKSELRTSSKVNLPREKDYGVKEFPEIETYLISKGEWIGTVTAYDWEYVKKGHASGGSLTMLYHEKAGPILSASMVKYQMIEEHNMQRQRDEIDMSLTPHLEYKEKDKVYRSDNDYKAQVEKVETEAQITFSIKGNLVDENQDHPESGNIGYEMEYQFKKDEVNLKVKLDSTNSEIKNIRYYIPVISSHLEQINLTGENKIHFEKNKKISFSANLPLHILTENKQRIFNQVPGLEALPLFFNLKKGQNLEIKIQ